MGNLTLRNCSFDLIPLENDLFSLEENGFVVNAQLNRDNSVLNMVAESIQRMQVVHGKFKSIYAKGDNAKDVFDIIKQKDLPFEDEDSQKTALDTLLVFDRSVDMVTPFCTAFTYEALVD